MSVTQNNNNNACPSAQQPKLNKLSEKSQGESPPDTTNSSQDIKEKACCNRRSQYKLPTGYQLPEGYTLLPPKVKCYLIMGYNMEAEGKTRKFLVFFRDSRIDRPWNEEKKRYGMAFPLSIEICGGNAFEDEPETCEETLKREVYEETGTYLDLKIEEIKIMKKTVVYDEFKNDEKKTFSVNEKHIYYKMFRKNELDLEKMRLSMKEACAGKNPEVEKLPDFKDRLAFKEKIQPILVPLEELFSRIKEISELSRKIKELSRVADLTPEQQEEKEQWKKKQRLLNYLKSYDVDGSTFHPDMIYDTQTGKPFCNFLYEKR